MKAVFNSSPLIFLSKLRLLDQAITLFSEVIIPDLVFEEITHKADEALGKVISLLDLDYVCVANARNIRMVKAINEKLGIGESEAIVLTLDYTYDMVILDDNAARQEALRIGLNVKGTLGIIKRLLELDLVHYDLNELYRDLLEINFRVKRNIFNQIFDTTL